MKRAAALCQQVGESPQRFAVLSGLCLFHFTRAEYQAAQAVAEQLLDLAQRQHDPAQLVSAHGRLGQILFNLGDFLKRTSLVVVHGGVARSLASPQRGEVHTPSTGRKPGEQRSKTQGESFLEITYSSLQMN